MISDVSEILSKTKDYPLEKVLLFPRLDLFASGVEQLYLLVCEVSLFQTVPLSHVVVGPVDVVHRCSILQKSANVTCTADSKDTDIAT